MTQSHGAIWWSELMTRDLETAKQFYAKTCGWVFETVPMPEGDYHMAMANGQPVAGFVDMTLMADLDNTAPHWFTYIAVDDLDAALKEVQSENGTILRAPFEVPDTGRIAIVQDSTGAAVGLMTPVPM